jgi:hypothetical protein
MRISTKVIRDSETLALIYREDYEYDGPLDGCLPTKTISGTCRNGTTVFLTGAATRSIVASGGSYSFSGLSAGVYVVTPVLAGFTFSPPFAVATLTTFTLLVTVNFASAAGPIPPAPKLPIPFSKRTTASVAVFDCIFIASPQGAQKLTTAALTIAALQLVYAQLVTVYAVLRHQDTANNRIDLYAAIATALIAVANLQFTINAMTATGDAALVLTGMQSVAASAFTSLQKVVADE